jgi:hypothetical protein
MAKKRAPKIMRINISAIRVSAAHWKRNHSKEDIEQLADAMSEDGVLSMPIVRPSPRAANFYELLGGRKRYEAAKLNSMPTINCIVVYAEDDQARLISLRENLLQTPMSAMERTYAMGELRDLLVKLRGLQQRGRPKKEEPVEEKAEKGRRKSKKGKAVKIPRPKPVTQEEVGRHHKVKRDTARRDLKRFDNLTKRAHAAYQAGAITTKQADLLAKLPAKEQDQELKRMREENFIETKKRLEEEEKQKRFDQAKKDAPAAARKALRALNKKVREQILDDFSELLQFIDKYDIDSTTLNAPQAPHIEQLGEYIETLWKVTS